MQLNGLAFRQSQPAPNLRLTRTALIEEFPQSDYIYGRWDAYFGAWKRTAAGVIEFVPSFTFEKTTSFGQYVDADLWSGRSGQRVRLSKVLEEYQDLIELDLFDLPESEESPEEVNAYLDLIPQRFKEGTGTLGSFSWLGLEACWYFEEFSDWLLRSRWHGRFASLIWELTDAKRRRRNPRRTIHGRIHNDPPLMLLSRFMAESEARRCISLLKRLNGGPLEVADLEGLRWSARSPQKVRALSHLPDLQVNSLRVLEPLPEWLARPTAMAGFLNGGRAAIEFFRIIQEFPILLDKTGQTWLAKRIAAIRNPADVDDLKERWERRLITVVPFPVPPVILPPPFEPIDMFKKLQHEGRWMQNCSASYFAEILAGKSYFYHWAGTELATVRLKCTPAGQWLPAEIKGFGNACLSNATVSAIRGLLAPAP